MHERGLQFGESLAVWLVRKLVDQNESKRLDLKDDNLECRASAGAEASLKCYQSTFLHGFYSSVERENDLAQCLERT